MYSSARRYILPFSYRLLCLEICSATLHQCHLPFWNIYWHQQRIQPFDCSDPHTHVAAAQYIFYKLDKHRVCPVETPRCSKYTLGRPSHVQPLVPGYCFVFLGARFEKTFAITRSSEITPNELVTVLLTGTAYLSFAQNEQP